MKPVYHNDSIRCYAYIAPEDVFGMRVNTLPAYWSVNAKIMDKWEKITGGKESISKSPKASILTNQVDNKCIIWEGAKLNEKTSFKESIIGANTEISSFSRVFNSIIMNNVMVKEKVALENCIVCDGAVIESGCKIKGCLIGSHHIIPEESDHTNEFGPRNTSFECWEFRPSHPIYSSTIWPLFGRSSVTHFVEMLGASTKIPPIIINGHKIENTS
ncbi:hypothetical protein NQ318_002094 [Aromia moschata]|uniref:EIF2B subunit epsilon/gamma LbH domain-containing protein n=1 Tax=Aromia moschata TaxID=1265417 RepID=A0AAV8Y7S8_9CUCU|nr:hypothetical protein NQ318_002094 [Aromia moschata]